jgi:hypothetical protein
MAKQNIPASGAGLKVRRHYLNPSLQFFSNPLLQYSITPLLHYSITPILLQAITPALHHSITPILQLFTNSVKINMPFASIAFYN